MQLTTEMTEQDILATLDHSNDGFYCLFISLGDVHSYLIDTRLNVFRADDQRWAIAIERLGYNSGEETLHLDIYYYGNCLVNLEYYDEKPANFYSLYPVANFKNTVYEEAIKSTATYWSVRDQLLFLNHNQKDYKQAGIELRKPDTIHAEEAARLMVTLHRDLFRATEEELYKSIPPNLKKILVLDAWFHRDFKLYNHPTFSDEHIRETFELHKTLDTFLDVNQETFSASLQDREKFNRNFNKRAWENDRPSLFETWKQLARVIVTGDVSHYNPVMPANTHWRYWTDSGSF